MSAGRAETHSSVVQAPVSSARSRRRRLYWGAGDVKRRDNVIPRNRNRSLYATPKIDVARSASQWKIHDPAAAANFPDHIAGVGYWQIETIDTACPASLGVLRATPVERLFEEPNRTSCRNSESSKDSSANIDQPHGFPFKLIRETPLFVPTSFRREPGMSAVATGGQRKVFHFLYY